MAREKAVIQKEWLAIATKLEAAVKKTDGRPVSEAELDALETSYAGWTKLLDEADKKVKDWGSKKQDADREKFRTFVSSQHRLVAGYDTKLANAKAARLVGSELDGMVDELPGRLDKISDNLDKCRDFIKDRSVEKALKEHWGTANAFKRIGDVVTDKGWKDTFAATCRIRGAPGSLKAADFKPAKFAASRKRYDQLEGELDTLEELIQDMEVDVADPDAGGSGDPAYKTALKELQAGYKLVSNLATSCVPMAQKLLVHVRTIETKAPALAGEQRQKAREAVTVIDQRVQSLENNLAREMAKIRNKDGALTKKKAEAGITKVDEEKYLTPIMSKAMSSNTRFTRIALAAKASCADVTTLLAG